MRIITWAQALAHLRIPDPRGGSPPSGAETDLTMKIEQAEALVLDYVNQRRLDGDIWAAEVAAWNTEDANALPPAQVQAAVLIQLKELDRFRGDDGPTDQPARDPGMVLHPRAAGYLHRHRDPAIA